MIKKIYILLFAVLINSVIISPDFSQDIGEPESTTEKFMVHEPVFDGNIYIRETGKIYNKTIILVHGIGEDASDIWKNLLPVLEENRFHVIYFDLPGFGRSDKANLLYSPKKYSALLKWIYDNYADGPSYFLGHSMGGAILLYYAGTYPETVHRIILADVAGLLHGAALSRTLMVFNIDESSKFGPFKEEIESFADSIRAVIDSTSERMPKDISLVLDTPFLRKIIFNNPKKIASAALINTDFSKQLENIKKPLFLIWGEKDPVAPLRTGKMLMFNNPGSSLSIMQGLGHNPMLENPSEFNRIITEYLSDNVKTSKPDKARVHKKSIALIDKENSVIEGEYDNIEISNCRNIRIINSESKNIRIVDSSVEIENTVIKSKNTGMDISGSDILMTGGLITSAGTGLQLSSSRLDLAGVKITAKKAAVSAAKGTTATIVFSLCRISSQFSDRYYHEVIEVREDNPL